MSAVQRLLARATEFLMQFPPTGQRIEIRVTPSRIPEQKTSHGGLLDTEHESQTQEKFGAILVPTNRTVDKLAFGIGLARESGIPLIVLCSKRVRKGEVIAAASREDVEVFAVDLPRYPAIPLEGTSFQTSIDKELSDVSSGHTRDLSTKRNVGLLIARMLGWQRLMFLDDDIFGISKDDVAALAAGLNNHNVSVLIPDEFQDNSVACHANRLSGEDQDVFASAGGMGVRCDRDDLPFFPNIYNEDWFFFADEAARRRINEVGRSRQKVYDPYEDPDRAVKEEFGDLLAEGLYARLDEGMDIASVDKAYWAGFIANRRLFLKRVARLLAQHSDRELDTGKGPEVRAAQISIAAAQRQLDENITADLCQKFIDLWQADLTEWRSYISKLPRYDSIASALDYLGLSYEVSAPSVR
jgi:hypothetical protein